MILQEPFGLVTCSNSFCHDPVVALYGTDEARQESYDSLI